MNYAILFLFLFILLLMLPLFIGFKFYFNLFNNKIVFSVSVFGIKFICLQAAFRAGQLVVFGKKQNKQFKLDLKDRHVRVLNQFMYLLFLNIKITKLNIFCEVGKTNDAFMPCVIKSVVDILLYNALCFAYTKKGIFDTQIGGGVSYDKNKFIFNANFNVILNLFIILKCFIQANIKIKKGDIYAKHGRWSRH